MSAVSSEGFKSYYPDYPGERSVFIHKKGSFKISEIDSLGCRFIKFISSSKTALIQKFQVFGSEDGSLNISMTFDPAKSSEFDIFFKKNNPTFHSVFGEVNRGHYYTRSRKDLKNTFKLISNNNAFPPEHLEKLNHIIATGKKAPSETGRIHLRIASKIKPAKMPYPGESAIFIHKRGNWEKFESGEDLCREIYFQSKFESGEDLCREIYFQSKTADSLIQEFIILGYKQGNVCIQIEFKPSDADKIERFFTGISNEFKFATHEKKYGFYKTANKKELKVVFDAMKAHNTFPEELLAKMVAIVEKGEIEPLPGLENNEEP